MRTTINGITQRLKKRPIDSILLAQYLLILAILPFHAFLTTWTITVINNGELVKSWKEILLLTSGVLITALFIRRPNLAKKIISRKINILIIIYAFINMLLLALNSSDVVAGTAGLAFNLRFFAMFILAQVLVELYNKEKLRSQAIKITLIGGVIVAIFGVMQMTILPDDFLTHFGYGLSENQPDPYVTIDQNEDFKRIVSTTRGPNPLGSYMAVVFVLIIGWILKKKNEASWYSWLWLVPVSWALYGSYSRSAWIGLAVGLFFCGLIWGLRNPKLKKPVIIALILSALILPVTIFSIRNTSFFQLTILHNDASVTNKSSDEVRLSSYQEGFRQIKENPLGSGPGSAGNASFYSHTGPNLSENYYIQVGQETGVIGLAIFISIIFLVGRMLFLQSSNPIALALFGGLIIISVVSLFLHGWQDETVAMIWWGLTGLYFKKGL